MRLLRVWLLVLLAILLPMRGAIAAASPCEGLAHHAPAQRMHTHHHMHAAVEPDAASAADHGAAHHDDAGIDKCNLCASCCSATPMPMTFSPTVAALGDHVATFPLLQAAAPTFLSEGQERPPRSI
ncbi:MAG: hypothetical protein ACTHL8_21075 [Burkholderiaceae bacterium]